jgi:hypothetical protein
MANMRPAAASKFCLKSKDQSNLTLHSLTRFCADCGAPPFNDIDEYLNDSDLDEPAPTSEHRPGEVDGAPHRPAITRVVERPLSTPAGVNLVPIQYPRPLPLQLQSQPQSSKRSPKPNSYRLNKGKSKATIQNHADQNDLQIQLLEQRADEALARAVLKRDELNDIFCTTSTVWSFLVMVAQVSWSQGKPSYEVFGTPIKAVNFKESTVRYTEFIHKLYTGAKVAERGFGQGEGTWLVSMNHLTAKGAVELNPEEWQYSVFIAEMLATNKWPAIAHQPTYHATLVWWPARPGPAPTVPAPAVPTATTTSVQGKDKGKGKRGHSRIQTQTDIDRDRVQELMRAQSVTPSEQELPALEEIFPATKAAAEVDTTTAANKPVAAAEEVVRVSLSGRTISAPKRFS